MSKPQKYYVVLAPETQEPTFWCRICKSYKPLNLFRRDYRREYIHYKAECLDCRRKYRKKYSKVLRKLGLPQNTLSDQKTCYICGESKRRLVFDHNHQTNKLRKKLCYSCNLLTGFIETRGMTIINKVIKYLEEFNG